MSKLKELYDYIDVRVYMFENCTKSLLSEELLMYNQGLCKIEKYYFNSYISLDASIFFMRRLIIAHTKYLKEHQLSIQEVM